MTEASAKPWPQTERIKAWSVPAHCASTAPEREKAQRHAALAVRGLMSFVASAPAGRWHELSLPDGSVSHEPTRATSPYHMILATNKLTVPAFVAPVNIG